MSSNKDGSGVRTTSTSLGIVEYLRRKPEGGRVEEVADEFNISTSTAHRHLQTLHQENYLVNDGGFYRLGMKFLSIGAEVQRRVPGYEEIVKQVKMLAEETGERVQFIVPDNGERVFLVTESGQHGVQADARVGKRGPMHCSAAGKVILSELPVSKVEKIIEQHGLQEVTENSITTREELYEELETIREKGYGVNEEESTIGLRAVAAAVTGPRNELIGALSISGPTQRIKGNRFSDELPDTVRGYAHELELNIEYS